MGHRGTGATICAVPRPLYLDPYLSLCSGAACLFDIPKASPAFESSSMDSLLQLDMKGVEAAMGSWFFVLGPWTSIVVFLPQPHFLVPTSVIPITIPTFPIYPHFPPGFPPSPPPFPSSSLPPSPQLLLPCFPFHLQLATKP